MSQNDLIKNPHTFLSETVSGNLKIWVSEMASELIKEYKCETMLEKSLCEIIANSYWRIISASKLMNEDLNLHCPSKEKNIYLNILSKELDRENRNYLTAINTLIEIKNPSMTINLNSENAYLWKNQQFNNKSTEQWKH